MEQLGFGQFLIEAKCQACGKNIEGDSERVLLIPMITTYHMDADDWGNHKMSPYVPHGASNHYCLECIHAVEHFSMPNPWFMSVEELQETTEWIEEDESKKRIGSAEKDEALRHALTSGDIRKFNAAMPTTAARDDLLARAKPVSSLAAKIADGMDGEPSTAEIADQILNDHKKWENAAARQSAVSGVDAQRVTLLEYLNSPQSRGKMLQAEREAARLWAEGQSENEIARRQGVDQSTVHRRIQAAKKKAYARR
jgi:DNA-binding CsgD family transcriptional regulator